jgi:hypothetical protein
MEEKNWRNNISGKMYKNSGKIHRLVKRGEKVYIIRVSRKLPYSKNKIKKIYNKSVKIYKISVINGLT